MAIPKNPSEQSIIPEEQDLNLLEQQTQRIGQSDELNEIDGAPFGSTDATKDFSQDTIQVASLRKKVTDTVSDAVDGTLNFFKDAADVNKPPASKNVQPEGDPLAKMDQEGNIFIRPLKAEEVEDL